MTRFESPFAVHVHRRCRVCTANVEVILLGGATEPREGFYRCPDCRRVPLASDAALEPARPQLRLVDRQEANR